MIAENYLPNRIPESSTRWRVLAFSVFTVALVIASRDSLVALVRLSMSDETFSYMPLIPVVAGYLLFLERKHVFSEIQNAFFWGPLLVGFGVFLFIVGIPLGEGGVWRDQLSLTALAALVVWQGGFLSLFGVQTFRKASFHLLFLLFLVPIPSFLLNEIVQLLQRASTEVASVLFQLTGVPILRNGFTFELPGLSVVVAEQCCGIRSSLSLFILAVLVARLSLRSPWRRCLLILSVLPITIFKNALRILTLSLLGAYVDQRILGSVLHRMGGIPFFVLAVLIFGCVLWFLRTSDLKEKA